MTQHTDHALPPAASVVIPTRGGRDRLHYPLDALRRQDRQDFEVIVVVDGDVDGTEEMLARRRAGGMTNLRSIVLPENRGRSVALNTGFSAARGEVLIRCDDDLEPAPDFVDGHVRAHRDEAGPAGVIGPMGNVFPDSAYAVAYGRPATERHVAAALALPPGEQWMHWAGNCSVTRRTHETVGPYDEDYRRYGWEDVDMGYRIHRAGGSVRIHPELETPHHVAATSTVSRAQRALHAGAARELFLTKHGAHALGPRSRPRGLWGLAVRGLAAVLTQPLLIALARSVDRLLPHVPPAVGYKLVSLLVESAGRAGTLHPARARGSF